MFEAVQFIENRDTLETTETPLGEFDSETDAADAARAAKKVFAATGSPHYAWWIVRKQGAELAEFIADSTSDKEFILDLNSGELVEIT